MYINSNERIRSITLHDARGRLVRSTSGLMQLTIADLVAGAYLVTVHTHAGTRSTARWVKTNE